MREKNAVTKEYVKNCRILADAFNQLLYQGKRVIPPDRLHPLNTMELALVQGAEGTTKSVEKYRDVLKYLSVMADPSATANGCQLQKFGQRCSECNQYDHRNKNRNERRKGGC